METPLGRNWNLDYRSKNQEDRRQNSGLSLVLVMYFYAASTMIS
jgi:hypothetical protein